MLKILRGDAPVRPGWPEMGILPTPKSVNRLPCVFIRHRESRVHRQWDVSHPVLWRDGATTAGTDHPREARRASRLPQAAWVRLRRVEIRKPLGARSGRLPSGWTEIRRSQRVPRRSAQTSASRLHSSAVCIHSCPGAPLARTEGRISLNRIVDRMSEITISEEHHDPAGTRRYADRL